MLPTILARLIKQAEEELGEGSAGSATSGASQQPSTISAPGGKLVSPQGLAASLGRLTGLGGHRQAGIERYGKLEGPVQLPPGKRQPVPPGARPPQPTQPQQAPPTPGIDVEDASTHAGHVADVLYPPNARVSSLKPHLKNPVAAIRSAGSAVVNTPGKALVNVGKGLGVAGLIYGAGQGTVNSARYAFSPEYRRDFTLATTPGHNGTGVTGYMNSVLAGMDHAGMPLGSGAEAVSGLYDTATTAYKNYKFERDVAPKIQQQVNSTFNKSIAPRVQAKLQDPNARITQADIRDFVAFQGNNLTPQAKSTLQQLIVRAKQQGGPEFAAWGPQQWSQYSRMATNVR